MHEDLVGLSDRLEGWDSDYALLAPVGREAVLAHPSNVHARCARVDLAQPHRRASTASGVVRPEDAPPTSHAASDVPPRPTEGQPIPSAYQSANISTPGWRIREVWTSPTEHHVEFDDPADATRFAALGRRVDRASWTRPMPAPRS